MGSAFKKAFTTQRSSNISEFKSPKLSKLAAAQTVESSLRCFKFRDEELLIACSMLSTMQNPY